MSNSEVQWAGTAILTTYGSGTRLTATISAADLTTVGTYKITVYNPTSGLTSLVQPLGPVAKLFSSLLSYH